MEKVIKYHMVHQFPTRDGCNAEEFNKKVNALIAEGYQPVGGSFAIASTLCQTMVMYKQ